MEENGINIRTFTFISVGKRTFKAIIVSKQMVLEHKQQGKCKHAAISPMAKQQSGKSKIILHMALLLQSLLCLYTEIVSV